MRVRQRIDNLLSIGIPQVSRPVEEQVRLPGHQRRFACRLMVTARMSVSAQFLALTAYRTSMAMGAPLAVWALTCRPAQSHPVVAEQDRWAAQRDDQPPNPSPTPTARVSP